jgi:diacylglycerol O-acyltransferase 1
VIVINSKYKYIGPANATIITSMYSILFLKMWSYVHVNYWCRNHVRHTEAKFGNRARSPSLAEFPRSRKNEAKPSTSTTKRNLQNIVQYPDNLSLQDIYYFWLAPTLCYELNFPKMERTRKL